MSSARNCGISQATGEYLLFLNSGDHFYNDRVLQDNQSHLGNYDLIYFDIEYTDGKISKIVSYPEKLSFSDLFSGSLPHPATLIRATQFDKIGSYDENYKIVSDWKFFILALYNNNCSYLKVNETLSTFYLDGISSDFTNKNIIHEERQHVLNSYFKGYIEDMNQLLELKSIVSSLRKSRKIGLLVKLGLIHKF